MKKSEGAVIELTGEPITESLVKEQKDTNVVMVCWWQYAAGNVPYIIFLIVLVEGPCGYLAI